MYISTGVTYVALSSYVKSYFLRLSYCIFQEDFVSEMPNMFLILTYRTLKRWYVKDSQLQQRYSNNNNQ